MKGEKTILRQHRRHHFVQIPNESVRDSRLSWKATGLLCFMLSLPDGWELNLAHLSSTKRDGRDATRAGMKELEDAGYLVKDVLRDEVGRIEGTQWIVSDFPFSENPKTVSPTPENPTQRIQTVQKKNIRTPPHPPASELFEAALWEASSGGKQIGEGWKRTVLARLEKRHDETDVKTWARWKQNHEQLAERNAQLAIARQAPVDPAAEAAGDAFRANVAASRARRKVA